MHSYIGNRKVPQILSLAASRVGEWSLHSWKWLSKMRSAVLKRIQIEKRLSSRTMRVDQREAIYSLLKVLLSHLDLKTMQVGIYNPEMNIFTHLSLNYLAHKAGLSLRRAQRAMAWLYEAGYVIGYRQSSFDLETNEYLHKPSVRCVTAFLLQDLGITSLALNRARQKSRKGLKLPLTNSSDKKESPVKPVLDTVKNMISSVFNKPPTKNKTRSAISIKEYTEKIEHLMLRMPEISFDEAKRMLPLPNAYK